MQAFNDALEVLKENSALLRVNKRISSKFSIYNVRNQYWICDRIKDDVFILTVKHVSMNLLERLKDLEPQLDHEIETLYKRLKS